MRPGDLVLIEAPALAAPLVREVHAAVLHAGGHPVPRIAIDGLAENLLVHGSDEQLEFVNPVRIDEIETGDVRIVLEGYWNTKALTGVDPARQARFCRAREQLRNRYLERAADGDLRWVLTAYPTNAAAQDAEMSLADYEEFVYGAGLLDADDPVAEWEAFAARLARVGEFLAGVAELRVVADGTDLTLGVAGRTGSRRRAARTSPTARSSRRRSRTASTARSTSRTRRSSRAARCTTCGCASRAARSSRRPPPAARTSSSR